jgi:hypothetical protein
MIDVLLASEHWDETYGTYFNGEESTDLTLGAGSYASGTRITSPFMIGYLSEAMDHAYRVTGRAELRRRLVAMARFVAERGLDPGSQYAGNVFGIMGGTTWHRQGFWDPSYTISLVNALMRGYRYTCDPMFYERARHFFERGTNGAYETGERTAPDGTVSHFVDTELDSASFYLAHNKGELQYTYLLFEAAE